MSCGNRSLVGVDGMQAGIYPLRCNGWTCADCGRRKVRRVMAQIGAGLRLGRTRFLTLTSPGGEDAATSWAELPARWKRFHQRLVRRYGPFEYLAVTEVQHRGNPHLHIVYRGQYMPQRVLGGMARESGFGRVTDIRDGHPGLVRYLAKYLTKDLQRDLRARIPASDQRGAGGGPPRYYRRVRMSRHWCNPLAKGEPEHHWPNWFILDGPPEQAVREVTRVGFRVVELVLGPWRGPVAAAGRLRWLRGMRARWSTKPKPHREAA